MERRRSNIAGAIVLVFVFTFGAYAQSTGFTYQGRLLDAGLPPTGNYDFEFRLFDSLVSGTQQGATLTVSGVSVTNGIFTVRLDFGAQFPGAARFLQIAVRPAGGGAFTTLAPRQPITSAPYAVKSLNADSATTATSADSLSGACVGCVTASQIGSVNGSAVTGEIPVASVPAGSGSYIQNTTSPQASSNFNISGTGTASIFNAATQYNIGGNHVLSNAGTDNLFAGVNANGGQFNLHNGFWFQNLTPTAAGVTVSGRVTTPDGYGIGGVRIILTGPDGVLHSTMTSTFGYYAFSGLTAGFTYILEVSSRRYTFANPTLVVFLNEDLANADFTALP